MKIKLLTISFTTFILLSNGCEKNNSPEKECVIRESITSKDSTFYVYYSGREKNGYATAIKLNKEWRASVETVLYNNLYDIRFFTFISENEPDYKTESIRFVFKVLNKGCYKLSIITDPLNEAESNYLTLDDDVQEDSYYVFEEEANNYIQIDTFDTNTKRLSGKFMVSFVKAVPGGGKKYNPDFVRFFNGEFHCNMNW